MKTQEVIDFLTPDLSDRLQVGFLTIIVALVLGTAICTHITAKARSWERKWNRGTPDDPSDDLDIEHGSVTDLWQAVSTTPEKLAEVMPSLLLVIGLLGTFLGLGIALNHASSILNQPDALSANGAAKSMNDLVGLLQGLGTKFKTSTWGITGFVLLKFWSECTRFPEKRLTWVIGKVKTELERRKQAEAAAADAKQGALFEQIRSAAAAIAAGVNEQTAQLVRAETAAREHAQTRLDAHVALICEGLERTHTESRATNETMKQFTNGVEGVIRNMSEAAQRMAAGADKVGESAGGLTQTVADFKQQFTAALHRVGEDLGNAIGNMSAQASQTFDRGSRQMENATNEISKALEGLSKDVKQTMSAVQESIGSALEVQKRASIEFTASTKGLDENLSLSTERFEKLSTGLDERLQSVADVSRHINSMGRSLDRTLNGFDEVIGKIAALPDTLEPLAEQGAKQQRLLEPLSALPAHQQAILHELQGLRKIAALMAATERTRTDMSNVE